MSKEGQKERFLGYYVQPVKNQLLRKVTQTVGVSLQVLLTFVLKIFRTWRTLRNFSHTWRTNTHRFFYAKLPQNVHAFSKS